MVFPSLAALLQSPEADKPGLVVWCVRYRNVEYFVLAGDEDAAMLAFAREQLSAKVGLVPLAMLAAALRSPEPTAG